MKRGYISAQQFGIGTPVYIIPEIGKTYEIINKNNSNVKFQYAAYLHLTAILKFVEAEEKPDIFLIEDLDENSITDSHGIVSSTKIKIIKRLSENEHFLYKTNSAGRVEWYFDYFGDFHQNQYDRYGNLIFYTNKKSGLKIENTIDSNGNIIERCEYRDDLPPYKEWFSYDEKNRLIHMKDVAGLEIWYEYDDNDNLIHSKYNSGFEDWYKYNENNQQIYYRNSEHSEYTTEYDAKQNPIHQIGCTDNVNWEIIWNYIYKDDGYEVSKLILPSNGKDYTIFDKNNRITYSKNMIGQEHFYTYDDIGNVIAAKGDKFDFEMKIE